MAALETRLLGALTHLSTQWSSSGTQAAVAEAAGVQIDAVDIPPVYVLGQEGPLRASTLATMLRLSRPTMSKQLTRLERAGFVERSADADDARAVIIRLSPDGEIAHRRLVAQGITMVERALNTWDGAEAARFTRQLERFVAALATP